MRSICFFILFAISTVCKAQNVGIGEPTPEAKLSIKSSNDLLPIMIVKKSNNDSVVYVKNRTTYFGGFGGESGAGPLIVNNRYFLPFDFPQLTILASGEKSGIFSRGSSSLIDFRNINKENFYSIGGFLGGAESEHRFSISYTDQSSSLTNSLLSFSRNGNTGIGTFQPKGRLQINHKSSNISPSLTLYDSIANGSSNLEFSNTGGNRFWQLRGIVSNNSRTSSFLDFASDSTIFMSLRGNGFLGIGNISPNNRLDVFGDANISGLLKINNNTGLAGQVLTSNGASIAPSWQSAAGSSIGCRVALSTDLAIVGNGTQIVIPFNVEDFDDGNLYNTATNVFTAPSAGLYQVVANLRWLDAIPASSFSYIRILKNTLEIEFQGIGEVGSGRIVTPVKLIAGDQISMTVYQDSGTNKRVNNNTTFFSVFRIY